VTSLTREKRFTLHEYVSEIDQVLKEGIQLRSSTFQLIRAAFDDEVTAEEIETFRKLIHKVQFPPTFWHYFAFRGHIALAPEQLVKDKDKSAKYSTIRGFAKTTLKSVSKATGLKTKGSSKKNAKYMLPGSNMLPMHGRLSIAENLHMNARDEDEGSELSATDHLQLPLQMSSYRQHTGPLDAKELERLAEGRYYRDWERLGLGRLDTLQASDVDVSFFLWLEGVENNSFVSSDHKNRMFFFFLLLLSSILFKVVVLVIFPPSYA
jgi:myotubularin-related protein 5/13